MKNRIAISLILCGLFLAASVSFAQTILPTTTLSSASYKGGRGNSVTLASVTGVVAGTDLYIDQELIQVESVPTTGTTVGVIRGYGGTQAQFHNSAALVFVVAAAAQPYALVTSDPQGACARGAASLTNGTSNVTSTLYLPIINQRTGRIFDCVGGLFQGGWQVPSQTAQYKVTAPNSGATAYTSTGTATTEASAEFYCTEADLPQNKLLTGIAVLNGGTVGTDKHLAALYDSAGNLIANSAVAGATTSGANTFQTFAFTSQYYAIGPALYFACIQSNGTTDNIRMVVTGTQDTYLTKGITGGTFGTVPATITVPTTFTTAVGPYQYVY